MTVPRYQVHKVPTKQVIKLNTWVKADIGTKDDVVSPPNGSNDWDFYLDLDLGSVTNAGRNGLRYVKGRWARHEPGSPDSNAAGLDITGTDTKAIPMDLPKSSWQGTWSHGFVGDEKVPISFWIYVGATKNGTITSRMRIFKVDDET